MGEESDLEKTVKETNTRRSIGKILADILDLSTDGVSYEELLGEYTGHKLSQYLPFLRDHKLMRKEGSRYFSTDLHKETDEDILPYVLEIMSNPINRGKILTQWYILLKLSEPTIITHLFTDLGMHLSQQGHLDELVEEGYVELDYQEISTHYRRTEKGDDFVARVKHVLKDKFGYEDTTTLKARVRRSNANRSYAGEVLADMLEYAKDGTTKYQIATNFDNPTGRLDFLSRYGLISQQDGKYYTTKSYGEFDHEVLSLALGVLFGSERKEGSLLDYYLLLKFSSDKPKSWGSVSMEISGQGFTSGSHKLHITNLANNGYLNPVPVDRSTFYQRTPEGDTLIDRVNAVVGKLQSVAR